MRRLLWVLVGLSLVAAACGGGDSDEADGSTEAGSAAEVETDSPAEAEAQTDVLNEEIDAAVTALADMYGDEGAFAVGVFALEWGYGPQQVVGGAIAGQIQTDGSIEGVDPEGPQLGLIVIDTNSVLLASYQPSKQEPVSIEEFRDNAAEQLAAEDDAAIRGATLLALILQDLIKIAADDPGSLSGRTSDHYSPDELIHAMILGISVPEYRAIGSDDEAAQDVSGGGGGSEPEQPTASGLTGTANLVTTDVGGAETCTADQIPVEATIFADNRVEISYVRTVIAGIPPGGIGPGDPDQYVECLESEKRTQHQGQLDVASGVVTFEEAGEAQVDVSDAGQASLQGKLAATDGLNNWTLDVSLSE